MRLLKNLFNRLSDSLLVTVPSRIRAAREFASAPVLRLVSSKPAASASGDSVTKRASSHSTGQLEALEEALRKSQAWFLARQDASEGYWVAELEA
ncbi:MAG: squalene--hopene cyclase, partial [Nitrospira sp.]